VMTWRFWRVSLILACVCVRLTVVCAFCLFSCVFFFSARVEWTNRGVVATLWRLHRVLGL
jgi:hypothetical protein